MGGAYNQCVASDEDASGQVSGADLVDTDGRLLDVHRYDYAGRCWWCGQQADSGEHKHKRTDLVREFGRGPWKDQTAVVQVADLAGANLTRAHLNEAYSRAGDFRGADFHGADLTRARLKSAYLVGANFTDAFLRGADFTGAYLSGAKWPKYTPTPHGWVRDPVSGRLKRAT